MAGDQLPPKFDLFKLPYPALRHFIEVLPVGDLIAFRQTCQDAHDVTKFRGKVIKYLTVSGQPPTTASSKSTLRTTYDDLLELRMAVMPRENVTVIFNGRIDADILGAIIDRTYPTLTICGEYGWNQVLPLLHNNLTSLAMYGTCMMTGANVERFFEGFRGIRNIRIRIICDNTKDSWINPARTAIYAAQNIDYDETISEDGFFECTKFVSLDDKYKINMYFLYKSDMSTKNFY
uniref:F-box domain-containing protein n=1 Tax=Panagrellus redivivus TaxID=6233 RepID=A0A7E4WE80_PANRE